MSSIGSPSPFFLAGKKAYEVDRSFRFNSASSTYLQRQPSSSTSGSTQKITISFWIKLGNIPSGTNGGTFFGTAGDSHRGQFFNQELYFQYGSNNWINTTGVFRDPSAWYHVVYAVDTTQSTTSNRQKIYVNGVLQGRGDTISDPSQNAYIEFFNNSSETYYIGRRQSGNYFDGYLAEINFLDGYAYDPSYFGKTNATTGQWSPKEYTGSYGTNGFYLDFSDNSSITNMCLDKSGNGNNFSPDNCNTEDSMLDTPTNNFAVMSPLTNYSGLSEGNLRFNNYNDSAGNRSTQATIALPKSGKWYWEARYSESSGTTTTKYFGVSQIQMNTGYVTAPYVYYDGGSGILRNGNASDNKDGKQVWYNGTGVPAVLAIAVDVDNNSVEYFHNGSSQGTIPLPTLTSSQEYFFTWANTSGGSSGSLNDTFNFGADSTFQGQVARGGNTDANGIGDFKYAPPSGHLALCSANLPDPTILKPTKHFGSIKYTGDGTSSHSITNSATVDFTPDWVWIKRNAAEGHGIFDSMRGVTKRLRSDTNNKETTASGVTAFINNGFTLGATFNINSSDYVSWNWNAGDADSKTFKVVVVPDSGNKYRFRNSADSATYAQSAVTLDLEEGGTYVFDWSDSTAQTHPIRFSTTSDGTHGGGSEYTTGVVKDDSAYKTTITVAASAPTLYYYCQNHSGMGGQINTNSTTGSTNFDGSTLSKVKKNLTAGFSIVRYVGTGNAETIGHGLGIAPKVIITKDHTFENNNGNGYSWVVATTAIDGSNDYLYLNLTNAKTDSSLSAPTSTVFSISNSVTYSRSGEGKINYCFNEVEGFSKFGSYVGNGSTDGTFVYTGFRPAYLIMKSSSHSTGSGYWSVYDNQRDLDNVVRNVQYPNENIADGVADLLDFTANGFKLRNTSTQRNGSSRTYFYYAFAESPFKNARAR